MSSSRPAEVRICGLAAVRARFQRDPTTIKRLYFDYATGRKIGVMCKVLAAARKIYRCVEPAELAKIADSVHHGGIVAVVNADPLKAPTGDVLRSWVRARTPVLLLDRIGNAHNLGAVARSAAFLGIRQIVLSGEADAARPSDAAYRVSEGGLELVELWQVPVLDAFCRQMVAAGYDVLGASAHGGSVVSVKRSPAARPLALVLGNEETGLDPAVASACSRLVTLPAHGKIDSLNVSAAAAVLMWELWARQGGAS